MQYLLLTGHGLPEVTTTCDFTCQGGYSTGNHIASSDAFELTLVTAGSWEVSIMGHQYSVGVNQMKVYPPMTARHARATGEQEHRHSSIYMKNNASFKILSEEQFFKQAQVFREQKSFDISDYRILIPMVVDCSGHVDWIQGFQSVAREREQRRLYSPLRASLLLMNLLLSVSERCVEEADIGTALKRKRMTSVAQRAIIYIHEHYRTLTGVDEIAQALSYNPSYLSTAFRQYTGTTIIEYVNKLRVEKAKILISDGMTSFGEVARAVGIDNVYYCYRIFKRYTGMTMGQYARLSYR